MTDLKTRIAMMEGTIEGLVNELAQLKFDAGMVTETVPTELFYEMKEPPVELKELFVLMDFETGGTFL